MDSERDGVEDAAAIERSRAMEVESLRTMAVDVMLAMISCVDHEKIGGATAYWPAIRKAIRVSAQASRTWGEWLEGVRSALKIEQLRSEPSNSIYLVGEALAARDAWPALRRLLIEETTLIEVKLRARREEQKQMLGYRRDDYEQ
jgi:hypothetical protein